MTHDPLTAPLCDWAEDETARQTTPLTPTLLRAKHLMALEDARRRRAHRLQAVCLALPVLFALGVGILVGEPGRLWSVFASPNSLMILAGALGLSAYVGGTWATE